MVRSFISRVRYPKERYIEHIKNRNILLSTFNAQTVILTTHDDINLAGLLIIRPHAKRVWLLCHGYRMAKERLLPFVELFDEDSLFIFDYRAHGESEGLYTSFGFHERTDVQTAITFLQTHPKTKNIPLYGLGISMGAVSLLGAAVDNTYFKAIILDSPFASLNKQIERLITDRYKLPRFLFPRIGKYIFEKQTHITIADVDAHCWGSKITTPSFIIYSQDDAVALSSDAASIYHAIQSIKDSWCVDHCQHARMIIQYPQEYKQHVYTFLKKIDKN